MYIHKYILYINRYRIMVITFDFHSKNVGSILTICNKLLTKTCNLLSLSSGTYSLCAFIVLKSRYKTMKTNEGCLLHISYYGNPRDFLTYDNGSVT